MAYERFESAQEKFDKFIHQFQPETKTLFAKLKRILMKLYKQNVSCLFNQTCLNEKLVPNKTHTQIYTCIHTVNHKQMCFRSIRTLLWG